MGLLIGMDNVGFRKAGGGGITEVEALPAKVGEVGLSPYLIEAKVEGSKLILQTGRKVCLGQLFTSTTDNNALYTVKTDANQSGWNEKQEQKDYVSNSSGSALGNLMIDLPNKNCFNLRLVKTASNSTIDIDFYTSASNISLRNKMQLNVPYEFIFHALSNDFTLNIKACWTNALETKAISLKRGRSLYIKVIRTNAIGDPADVCRFLECVVTGGVCDTNNKVTVVNKDAFLTHDLKSVGTINGIDLMVRLPNYSHWYETPLTVDSSSSEMNICWNTGATGYECNATWNDYLIVQVPEAITRGNSRVNIISGRDDILPSGATLEELPILSQGTTIVLQCTSANGSKWTFRGVFPKEEVQDLTPRVTALENTVKNPSNKGNSRAYSGSTSIDDVLQSVLRDEITHANINLNSSLDIGYLTIDLETLKQQVNKSSTMKNKKIHCRVKFLNTTSTQNFNTSPFIFTMVGFAPLTFKCTDTQPRVPIITFDIATVNADVEISNLNVYFKDV